MSGRMEGKVAFITGGARGQGRSHAVRLAEEGADIITLDLCGPIESIARYYPPATPEDLEETVQLVEKTGRRIVARQGDVRDRASIERVLGEGLEAFGHLDVVCANAGVFVLGGPAHLGDPQEWKDIFDVNVTGIWHTCTAATPHLIARGGGSIVITSSGAGLKGTPNVAPYTSSKHAAVGLMKTLALELGPHNIRVNAIMPTVVPTPMIINEAGFRLFVPDAENPTLEDVKPVFQSALHSLPIPWVEPVDISNAVLFLASDESRYITGLQMTVDGGFAVR